MEAAKQEAGVSQDLGPKISNRTTFVTRLKPTEKKQVLKMSNIIADALDDKKAAAIFKHAFQFNDKSEIPDVTEFRHLNVIGAAARMRYEALGRPLAGKTLSAITTNDLLAIFAVEGQKVLCHLTKEEALIPHRKLNGDEFFWQLEDDNDCETFLTTPDDAALRIQVKHMFVRLKAFQTLSFSALTYDQVRGYVNKSFGNEDTAAADMLSMLSPA